MKCFAYIRVSTTKQRDQGVSLEAQRDAIERYARANGLTITRWFQEARTAGKRGRVAFAELIRRLKAGEAGGAIVHKIDRSARNLRDWSDFIGLMDYGVAIHVVSENLDLTSRGGRLSADIQAVVAADYIRNLRLEALKGIDARYRQGLLPGRAPLGYRDHGAGKVKTIDPVSGPLVRELFERYATGRYNYRSLRSTMTDVGLWNQRGRELSVNSVAKILGNPFYVGVLRVKRTGETYPGKHEPLITSSLFEACEALRTGRTKHRAPRHRFTYSRLVRCGLCGYSLIAERQKGHVYYRCHTKDCPVMTKREELVERSLERAIRRMSLDPEQRSDVEAEIDRLLGSHAEREEARRQAARLERDKTEVRLSRLTDLLLDEVIGRAAYEEKKSSLTERLAELRDQIERPSVSEELIRKRIGTYLELAESAWLSYRKGSEARRRQIVETVTSNLTATLDHVVVELQMPFSVLSGEGGVCYGGPQRDVPRTATTPVSTDSQHLARRLIDCAKQELEEETGD